MSTKAGINFATAAHVELTNEYQDLVHVTVTAPSKGFVLITGSGRVEFLNPEGMTWAGISVGKKSGKANSSAETGVELPLSAPVAGTYKLPFSLTTVLSVPKGETTLYMVGIKDPNPHECYANGLSLTVLFIKNKI